MSRKFQGSTELRMYRNVERPRDRGSPQALGSNAMFSRKWCVEVLCLYEFCGLNCQAQGQTGNVKSKLGPEIGSEMGWPTKQPF